ncbi:AzlD domain-containing protein [Granulicoccus phenolivorans]|uniref:AzlD domain-containing protein n=1 Tax=Granulicoccus phenolivorans TaxID=266854 RepID=UPI000426F8B2|nr:AzlD domain-containing protein [Granulicoccus phenolivorans]
MNALGNLEVWLWIAVACVIAYATKLAGYLLPRRWLARPWVMRASQILTVGLLTSLVVTNTVVSGTHLTLDARLLAVGAAAVALVLRAPYLVVVIVGAAAAALGRWAGIAA